MTPLDALIVWVVFAVALCFVDDPCDWPLCIVWPLTLVLGALWLLWDALGSLRREDRP